METIDLPIMPPPHHKPPIWTLCGSTRFMDTFAEAMRVLSLRGVIVLTVAIPTHRGGDDPEGMNPDVKDHLDELHLRKMDISDAILVLNLCGYLGESTRTEVQYARSRHIPVVWWEPTFEAAFDERVLAR